jgi:hypothetical protein
MKQYQSLWVRGTVIFFFLSGTGQTGNLGVVLVRYSGFLGGFKALKM